MTDDEKLKAVEAIFEPDREALLKLNDDLRAQRAQQARTIMANSDTIREYSKLVSELRKEIKSLQSPGYFENEITRLHEINDRLRRECDKMKAALITIHNLSL